MDARTRKEKLVAMATQTASPHESQIARRLLAEEGIRVDAPAAPAVSSSSTRVMTRDQILGSPDMYDQSDLDRFDVELDVDDAVEMAIGRARAYFGRPGPKVVARG